MFTSEDPFSPVTYRLRVPLRKGEVEIGELVLQPPVLKDILRTDGHHAESVAYGMALLSSMTGVPESVLGRIVPEDWADLRVVLAQTNMRFMGPVNLLDKKEGGESEGPTRAADTPPPSSATTLDA
jgi:hypothetical protein